MIREIREEQTIGGDKIEIEGTTDDVDRWFKIMEKDIQKITEKEGKPINSIEPIERNRLLGGYFKKMSEIAEVEGRLIGLPIKGINNREQIIVSPSGQGLYIQEESIPETDKTSIVFNLFNKNAVRERLEKALKNYPAKFRELEEAGKKAQIEKFKISEGKCRVLLEKIFGERQR